MIFGGFKSRDNFLFDAVTESAPETSLCHPESMNTTENNNGSDSD